ncbi:MRJP domain containing protein [Asbolus verrucosus]|uniref:MRJP domain containing protein n=1 Tax=Asbolus verrucosus TaxID=1661398 RepID=A0A482VBW8_ASBVE|nr:MRJP domain containing protein [Asbolus verrucosus]
MNSGSTCDAIQNVLSMEIDKDGIMWVLDARRVDNNTNCPPKIILLDLNDKGKIVNNFMVPDNLCPHDSGCFLNDIVVDHDYAYISDTTSSDPGIFVYNRKSNAAWKARDKTMFGDLNSVNFTAQGVENKGLSHINGIALSCGKEERIFFFMPQTSLHIFSISNSILKNRSIATGGNLHNLITDRGTKQGQSGGMMCDTDGNIYYGILPLDAVGKWNITKPLSQAEIVEQNHDIVKWPDSFSIYRGDLYLITNSISKFSTRGVDKGEINFRIIKLRTNTESYIYC